MYETAPDHLPELLPKNIVEFLASSNQLLKFAGVDELLAKDYERQHSPEMEKQRIEKSRIYGGHPFFDLDAINQFNKSNLPMGLLNRFYRDHKIVDLAKIDDFGQVYMGYTINIYSCSVPYDGYYFPSLDELPVSKTLVYTAMAVSENQLRIGWNPILDPKDSNRLEH